MSDDEQDEVIYNVTFEECTCEHTPDEHGWGRCGVRNCDCEGGWVE